MAHTEQIEFCRSVALRFPQMFYRQRVLDVGALDVNGNNRHLFRCCDYVGLDIAAGPNVDVVVVAHEFTAPDASFDVVISTECLEHDRHFPQTLRNCVRLLRAGGLFIFTCATEGRARHGTRDSDPLASPFTAQLDDWGDYYRNLNEPDIRASVDIDRDFASYEFDVEANHCDLRFWGIRNSA